jgi:hypothetical protein
MKCRGEGGWGTFGACGRFDMHYKRPCPACKGDKSLPFRHYDCPKCRGLVRTSPPASGSWQSCAPLVLMTAVSGGPTQGGHRVVGRL